MLIYASLAFASVWNFSGVTRKVVVTMPFAFVLRNFVTNVRDPDKDQGKRIRENSERMAERHLVHPIVGQDQKGGWYSNRLKTRMLCRAIDSV
jgi:hypothetical protein